MLNAFPDERGGFGLAIVEACSSRWGTELGADGKRVWFEIEPPI